MTSLINKQSLISSAKYLLLSNIFLGTVMSMVYYLGKESVWSTLLIYSPISMIYHVSVRDNYSSSFVFSCALAITHGLAHVIYPFIDELTGVNSIIDVWQDQILHFLQAVLFSSLYWNNGLNLFLFLFILGSFMNVMIGYLCWGTEECHDLYVLVSIIPALASGLHFATGTFFQSNKKIATSGFVLQGTSSVMTYFMFKASDDMLKFFALCRFFEIYFIVPHYVGFFYSRYVNNTRMEKESFFNYFLRVIGVKNGGQKLPLGYFY